MDSLDPIVNLVPHLAPRTSVFVWLRTGSTWLDEHLRKMH